jgi:hypothetical protein
MGYYYHDPSGLGAWYVNDNETPKQAFDRLFGGTGASVDDKLRQSVTSTPAAYQLASEQPPPAPAKSPPRPAPSPITAGRVETATPAGGVPKSGSVPLRGNVAPVVTGEPISTAILTGLSFIFGIFGGGGMSKQVKTAIETLRSGIKDVFNTLLNFIWTMSHIVRWVLNALRQLWERVLRPLIDHINKITSKIEAIINRVLRPYLRLIDHIRMQILGIYRRFFLPVIRFIQEVRVLISLLRLAHVPGMKQLDEKLAKIEGKLIGIIQGLLSRVNDHSGFFNILMTARLTLQRGILLPSFGESRGSFINAFYNYQSQPIKGGKPAAITDREVSTTVVAACKTLGDSLRSGAAPSETVNRFCRIVTDALNNEQ